MEKLFSIREVAGMLGVCEKTIRRAVKRGDIRPLRVGVQLRFTKTMLDAWMNQNARTPRKMPREGAMPK